MQVDLTQEELKILLYAANMYKAHVRQCNLELAGIAEERKKRERKSAKSDCFCCIDMPSSTEPKRPFAYASDEDHIRLQEKLRKAEMQLPMEEHKYKKYSYEE